MRAGNAERRSRTGLNEWTPKGALPRNPAQRARSRQGRIELGGRQNSGSSDRYGFCGLRHGCRCAPRSSVSFLLNGSGEAATQSGSLAQASKTASDAGPKVPRSCRSTKASGRGCQCGTIAGQPRLVEPRHVTRRATSGGPSSTRASRATAVGEWQLTTRGRRHGGDDRSKVSA